jgi:hypothetical protein
VVQSIGNGGLDGFHVFRLGVAVHMDLGRHETDCITAVVRLVGILCHLPPL